MNSEESLASALNGLMDPFHHVQLYSAGIINAHLASHGAGVTWSRERLQFEAIAPSEDKPLAAVPINRRPDPRSPAQLAQDLGDLETLRQDMADSVQSWDAPAIRRWETICHQQREIKRRLGQYP